MYHCCCVSESSCSSVDKQHDDIPGTPENLAKAVSYLSETPDIAVQVEAEYAAKGVRE